MRLGLLFVLAPLALAACGHDDRPVVVNTPPAPSSVVVPAPAQPQPMVVVPPR